jgi:CRP-like cAMP-binding protein
MSSLKSSTAVAAPEGGEGNGSADADINVLFLGDPGMRQLFAGKPVRYAAKSIVYNEGVEADTVIALRSGMVKLISHLPNGRARIVRVHARGAWLGLGGLLGQPYEHTAIAVEDTDAYRVPVGELLRIKAENPYLYCRLIERWFDYLQEADLWIAEFSTGSIKARVARLVNFLSQIEERVTPDEVKLLTCEEMAEILGATPESVSRVLAEFKRSNILSPAPLQASNCYHRDAGALEALARH